MRSLVHVFFQLMTLGVVFWDSVMCDNPVIIYEQERTLSHYVMAAVIQFASSSVPAV